MRKPTVYIAAPFFNEHQIMIVEQIEHLLSVNKVAYHSPRTVGVIKSMTEEQKAANSHRIYNDNINKIIECDCMILSVDDKHTGTLFELGYAVRLKEEIYAPRKVITYSSSSKPVNLMLAHGISTHCAGVEQLGQVIAALGKDEKLQLSLAVICE